MRPSILIIFAFVALLGIGLTVWSIFADASVTASTGAVYTILEAHGQADEALLRDDLYGVVLALRWPWLVVQWTGLAVLALACVGLIAAWRDRSA
jgi:hypothetical protein